MSNRMKQAADIRFVNLEGPFAGASTDPLVPDIPHKSWTHSEPDQVDTLVAGGKDIQAAHRPLVLERRGVKVGFLSYAATVFPFNHAATAP